MKKWLKIAGVVFLAWLLLAGACVCAIVAGVYFFIFPPVSEEKTLEGFFGLASSQVRNFKGNEWVGCRNSVFVMRFEVVDEGAWEEFLKKKKASLETTPTGEPLKTFKKDSLVSWWRPDEGRVYECYRMPDIDVGKSIRMGHIYFDREKKIVFAEFVFLY